MTRHKNQFPFLELPGELRNQIYRCLYNRPYLADNEACDHVIPRAWTLGLPMPEFSGLKALMRACRRAYLPLAHCLRTLITYEQTEL
jgi:hypothetical protein